MVRRVAAARVFVLAALSGLGIFPARAADDKPWSLQVKAGYSYDDNVVVEQTDILSGVGDSSANLELSAKYRLVDDKTNKLSAGYDFSQSLHSRLSAFDIQIHDVSLSGSTKFEDATLGLGYNFYHLLLGGRNFLDMHAVNPSILVPVTQQLYLRGSYFYLDKTFLTASNRDGAHHEPELGAYYLFDRRRAYAFVGAQYESEDTRGAEFAYRGYALKTSLQLPLEVFGREGKATAGYTYLHRNYRNITPSIGANRYEVRSTFKVGASIPVIEKLSLSVDYQHVDRSSNLPTTNYKENVVTGALSYTF